MQTTDSLRKRYIYKVFGNVVTFGANAVTQIIIPRALGPAQYGNFNFLTDFFTQVMGFLNMGTSIGFYTKISKRPREQKLPSFYLAYIALCVMAAFFMVLVLCAMGWRGMLWPGQAMGYVYAAVLYAALLWFSTSINDIIDAYGLTVALEKSRFFQKVVGLLIIIFMFCQQMIKMGTLFFYNYIIFLIAILVCFVIARRSGFSINLGRLTSGEIRTYSREFYKYSQPFFIFSLVGLGDGLFNRWFLQVMGGGIQQGFYSLSYRIGAICFLLTGAMSQLITREFSIAYEKKDLPEMARLFRRHIPLLYGVTALISALVVVNADKVTLIIGGRGFHSAVLPVAIMALYPLHQTYGQLSSAVFYATDQTRLYRNIGITFMLLGLPATYFLLASPSYYGFGFGAVGLAIKMVVFNIVTNNVYLYYNARFLRLPLSWYVVHQLVSVLAFLAIAWVITLIVDRYFVGVDVLWRFSIIGLGYGLAVLGAVLTVPGLLGLSRPDIAAVTDKIKKWGGS